MQVNWWLLKSKLQQAANDIFSNRTFVIYPVFFRKCAVHSTSTHTSSLHSLQMFRLAASFEYFPSPQANRVGVSSKSVNKLSTRWFLFLNTNNGKCWISKEYFLPVLGGGGDLAFILNSLDQHRYLEKSSSHSLMVLRPLYFNLTHMVNRMPMELHCRHMSYSFLPQNWVECHEKKNKKKTRWYFLRPFCSAAEETHILFQAYGSSKGPYYQ